MLTVQRLMKMSDHRKRLALMTFLTFVTLC